MSGKNPQMSLAGIASAMPENKVGNDFFPEIEGSKNKMFLGTRSRRHIQNESSTDLFVRAGKQLGAELNIDLAQNVDTILTNVSLPEQPFTGCGAMVAKHLGIRPKTVIDLHNGGCVSFIVLMDFARGLMQSHGARNVLICVAQTAAGRVFAQEEVRKKPQSRVPGDGAAVALLTHSGESPVSPIIQHCFPEYSEDMVSARDGGSKYWEPGMNPLYLDFPEAKVASIVARGNKLVPQVMKELMHMASLRPGEIDGLITNQPNPTFLRNWREAIELPPEKHFDTFEEYSNLFQAGIPVTLDHAIRSGKIKPNQKIVLAGFSHAGDYSAAALLHYLPQVIS